MCGIAGIASFNSEHLEAEKTLNKMLCAMAHRGNDGRGTFKGDGGHVLLGHLRLAIIDLSVSANQPMQSLDGRYSITFNGEIYNYKELAKELGCPDDVGDTYVLIVAFTRWGKDCLPRLRGMFAFAIW
ncbi:hypothetical protein KAU11_03145, partial [Candidatus Babeliales bacterium]|nr:hypothetical protein [Candidatus Babeliales bacterium]